MKDGYIEVHLVFQNGVYHLTEGRPVTLQGFEFMECMAVHVAINSTGTPTQQPPVYQVSHGPTGMRIPCAAGDTEDIAVKAATNYLANRKIKKETWEATLAKAKVILEEVKASKERKVQYAASDINPE